MLCENPMTKEEYNRYMSSAEWKAKRQERLEIDKHTCRRCGSSYDVIVHHITYRNIGHEGMEDLVTLCRSCHAELHRAESTDRRTMGLFNLDILRSVFEMASPAKGKIMSYLLEQCDLGEENFLYLDAKKISDKTGVSCSIAETFLRELDDNDIIVKRNQFIIVNPKFFHKGDKSSEVKIQRHYEQHKEYERKYRAKKKQEATE